MASSFSICCPFFGPSGTTAGLEPMNIRLPAHPFVFQGGKVQRKVMPFYPPAPGLPCRRVAENGKVIFAGVAVIIIFPAAFQRAQHIFQLHNSRSFRIAVAAHAMFQQGIGGSALFVVHFFQGGGLSSAVAQNAS